MSVKKELKELRESSVEEIYKIEESHFLINTISSKGKDIDVFDGSVYGQLFRVFQMMLKDHR